MTVTVQGSKVLSPATFRILPLKGTSTFATLEAGSVDDLHRNLKLSFSSAFQASWIDDGNDAIETSNKLGRPPPPDNLDLKAHNVLVAAIGLIPPYVKCDPARLPRTVFYQTVPTTSWNATPVLVATKVRVI